VKSDTRQDGRRQEGRRRGRRGEGARLRTELIDAAEARLAATGAAELVSLRGVAADVGVTAPAIYRHFPDKEALLHAVVARRFADFRDRLVEAAAGVEDPFEGLRRSGLAYLAFAEEHPAHYRVLFGWQGGNEALGLAPDDPVGHPGDPAMAVLIVQIERCLASGPGGRAMEASVVAAEAWAMTHGLVDLRACRPGFAWPAPADVVGGWVDRLRTAVAAGGGRSTPRRPRGSGSGGGGRR
jgi:AcrR family transcriptional regulator